MRNSYSSPKFLLFFVVLLNFISLAAAKDPKGLLILEPPFSHLASEFYSSATLKTKNKNRDLIELKEILGRNDISLCLKNVAKVKANHKELLGWLFLIEFQCLNSLQASQNTRNVPGRSTDNKIDAQSLKIFSSIEIHKNLLKKGPWSEGLRKLYVPTLIRWTRTSENNSAILKQLNFAIEMTSELTNEQQSKLLEAVGDFYNRIKRIDMSQPFYKRAYGVFPSRLLATKIDELIEDSTENIVASCTEEEKTIGNEIIELVRKGSIDSKNEKLESLQKLKTTCREYIQTRLFNIWQSSILSANNLEKINFLGFFYFFSDVERVKILKSFFSRSAHNEILLLTEKLNSMHPTTEFDFYYWRARAFTEILKLSEAAEAYTKAIKVANDLNSKEDALLRLGFILLRDKKIEQAIQSFMQTSESTISENRARALFWIWQSYVKLDDKEKAASFAKKLMSESPDSYWGLKAQIASNDGKIKWRDAESSELKVPTEEKKIMSEDKIIWPVETVALTEEWNRSYLRYKTLATAGWWSEALKELKSWPVPISKNDRWARMRLFTSVLAYPDAYNLMKEEDVLGDLPIHYLKLVFPKEFDVAVQREAKKVGLHPVFIQSVMKQESAFYPFAISPAKAMGLLQLVPNTAKENAKLQKLTQFKVEDLYEPAINIQLGANYMGRLVRKYQNHIPLALVAYNAGPGRLDRWLKKRDGMLPRLISSQEDFEDLWLEEIPWRESQIYVRRILRNWLIMRSLYENQAHFISPVWSEVLFTSVKPLDTL